MAQPVICAAICTYNRYDLLPTAIESVIAQKLDVGLFEIIIVDNTPDGQNDEGKRLAGELGKISNLTYLFEGTPGLSNARNVATRASRSEYIVFLDDDAIAVDTWLGAMIKAFQSHEKVGVVGGRIMPIFEVPRPSWLHHDNLGYVSVVDWGGQTRIASEDEWFAGANIAFSREALEATGGFNTNLGRNGKTNTLLSNEESDVIEGVVERGWKAVYCPEASVDHMVVKERLTRDWFRKRAAWQAISDVIKGGGGWQPSGKELMATVRAYISSLPPLQRNIQGLYMKTSDAEQFKWQLAAIYCWSRLTAIGYTELEDE